MNKKKTRNHRKIKKLLIFRIKKRFFFPNLPKKKKLRRDPAAPLRRRGEETCWRDRNGSASATPSSTPRERDGGKASPEVEVVKADRARARLFRGHRLDSRPPRPLRTPDSVSVPTSLPRAQWIQILKVGGGSGRRGGDWWWWGRNPPRSGTGRAWWRCTARKGTERSSSSAGRSWFAAAEESIRRVSSSHVGQWARRWKCGRQAKWPFSELGITYGTREGAGLSGLHGGSLSPPALWWGGATCVGFPRRNPHGRHRNNNRNSYDLTVSEFTACQLSFQMYQKRWGIINVTILYF